MSLLLDEDKGKVRAKRWRRGKRSRNYLKILNFNGDQPELAGRRTRCGRWLRSNSPPGAVG